mgnify:CR=1 FL=1
MSETNKEIQERYLDEIGEMEERFGVYMRQIKKLDTTKNISEELLRILYGASRDLQIFKRSLDSNINIEDIFNS